METQALLDFEWRDLLNEEGRMTQIDSYTFLLPDGMTPQDCKDFLDGLGWENDVAEDPGHPRLCFRWNLSLNDFYYSPEGLSRDDVVAMLEAKGFARIDNYQDHLESLDN